MKHTSRRMPAVPGFRASGIACGLKPDEKKDLALLVSDVPATAAGVFTRNRVRSPSVEWSRRMLARTPTVRAVLVNSGNANACTGPQGWDDCRTLATRLATELAIDPREILIASTGVIGVPLPVQTLVAGLPQAVRSL
ncbi:MAG: bifunctional glutamate N-acetyltransferase/amino-acid acetyltransferase ArgJ, partial [Nitrospinaceae bacterium]|nr:bifunctional glutamate N-acetyltransferase/amino-acid acetyltransferase ArgJ [Nitrospinaceae bacterium]NIS84092.1 bifunctional glutamate N-acetyltransferase/amino-acid acetyltransferase ArgJ [Nitrospinaceae bacterium]